MQPGVAKLAVGVGNPSEVELQPASIEPEPWLPVLIVFVRLLSSSVLPDAVSKWPFEPSPDQR